MAVGNRLQRGRRTAFSLILFGTVSLALCADESSDLDAVFAGIDPQGPGCNVGVIREGAWAYKKGHGMANLELDVPLDGSQLHRMGSVSKQFTAMAVRLLADEGRIDL